MMEIAFFLAVLVCALALGAAHLSFWTYYYRRRRDPDERHFIQSVDGWTLALARFRSPGGPPVLCCPGLACNGRLFDFQDDLSLARHLQARGFDVWVLDLRGTGQSQRPQLIGRSHSWEYGFEEYALQDAPAALEYIATRTGAKRIAWVGHSMGGLIAYHAATRTAAGQLIGAVVSLGSPADFAPQREHAGTLFTWFVENFLSRWPVLRLGRSGRFILPYAGRMRPWPEKIFLSTENMPGISVRRFLAEILEDVPRKLIDQFANQIVRGLGFDGQPLLKGEQESLKSFNLPLLTIAGSRDFLVPPASVAGVHSLLNSSDHSEVVMGEQPGFGHLDLLLGQRAAELIYPQISEWLEARLLKKTCLKEESSSPQPD